jgi:hypothetical protein
MLPMKFMSDVTGVDCRTVQQGLPLDLAMGLQTQHRVTVLAAVGRFLVRQEEMALLDCLKQGG